MSVTLHSWITLSQDSDLIMPITLLLFSSRQARQIFSAPQRSFLSLRPQKLPINIWQNEASIKLHWNWICILLTYNAVASWITSKTSIRWREAERETAESNTISTEGMQRVAEAVGAQVSDSHYQMMWLGRQARDAMFEEKRQSFIKSYDWWLHFNFSRASSITMSVY